MELLKIKSSRSHLGFCIQLKFYQNTGLFPQQRTDISEFPILSPQRYAVLTAGSGATEDLVAANR